MPGIGKLAAVVVSAGLMGCSGALEASLSPVPTATFTVSSPAASPIPSPTAVTATSTSAPIDSPSAAPQTPPETAPVAASPTIGATPDAASPVWIRAGRIGNGEIGLTSVVGFAGGFVAVDEGATFAFSADGREWQTGSLAETIQDCAGNPTNDAYVSGAATDGQGILVLGKRREYTAEICSDPDHGVGAGAITWLSTDGRTWTRSSDFAHEHAIASHAWPIPGGGWEVSVYSWARPSAIWQSADGLSWHETASFPEQVGSPIRGAADTAGTRLLEIHPDEEPLRLLTSSDGANWDALPAQLTVSQYAAVMAILPPAGSGRPWIIVTSDARAAESATWTSADHGKWTEHDFPGRRIVTNTVAISDGYLATAERFDFYELACEGVPRCPGPTERQYFSPDGVGWTEIPLRLRDGAFFAESPAGVITVGRYNGSVWLLER